MENVILNCVQCHRAFPVTIGEQRKFEKMGFDLPRSCPPCRKNKMEMIDSMNPPKNRRNRDKKKHYRFKYE